MAFHFLHLPGELRNKIYGYALCDTSAVGRSGSDCVVRLSSTSSNNAANLLQQVNRQLRQETQHLETNYMDLVFEPTACFSSARHFACSFNYVPAHQRRHIRKVTLIDNPENDWNTRYMRTVYQLCNDNPNAEVQFRLTALSVRYSRYYLIVAYSLLTAVRNNGGLLPRICSDSILQQRLAASLPMCPNYAAVKDFISGILPLTPSNFKFFPLEDQFDEALFRKSCRTQSLESALRAAGRLDGVALVAMHAAGSAAYRRRYKEQQQRGLNIWVELAKEIAENSV